MGSKVQIKHRYTGEVLFECDVPEEHIGMSMRHALESAAKSGANLSGANLSGANLSWANLSWANLSRANLSGANLSGAYLSGAYLSGADLSGAYLSGAKIDGEDVTLTPISICGLEWFVLITDGYMRIGCQRHTHSEWVEFSESQIAEMSDSACEFWSQWKAPLLSMCAAHASMVKPQEAEAA